MISAWLLLLLSDLLKQVIKGTRMAKKDSRSIRIPSAKNQDQPATRKMLSLVRDELKSEIRALDLKIESRFKAVDSRFEEMKTESVRTNILLEEQHSNNRIVLEGLQALWQRQDRIEKRFSAWMVSEKQKSDPSCCDQQNFPAP